MWKKPTVTQAFLLGMALMLVIALCASGCTEFDNNQIPNELQRAPKPLIIVSNNGNGIVIKDGNNDLYCYSKEYYLSRALSGAIFTEDTLAAIPE